MAYANMSSILAKAQSYMNSNKGRIRVNDVVKGAMLGSIKLQSGNGSIHTPEEAASKFIEVLLSEIGSSGLSPGAAAAISNISHTSATYLGDNKYMIGIYFSGDLSRPSLEPETYGAINNLAALFNNGVDHTMRPVHGIWHGHDTWSKTVIPGTHFVQSAISSFMGGYASEYNVIDIQIDGAFS